MASRAARKILKERELQAAAAADTNPKIGSDDSEEEEEATPFIKRKMNAFEMLMAGNDDNDEDEDAEVVESEPEKPVLASPPKPTSTQSKKKNKKKKGKGKGKADTPQSEAKDGDNEVDDDDEVERALKEVNDKLGVLETTPEIVASSSSSSQPAKKQRDILAIDLKLLDSDAEMRKLFGSKIMAEAQAADMRGKRNMNVRRRQLALGFDGKTYLVKPKEQWPRIPSKVGVSMNMLQAPSKVSDAIQVPGYFEFTFSNTYAEIQVMFLQCVNTHDPATINNLLHAYPFHIDALLQCSEVAKHNGDINTAAEYIERALFVFERAFHPLFNMALANSILPYTYAENRAFFLALSRHIGFISRKGCWRTCLELSKLLFSLDPEDPLGALQMMDWYAVKAGERQWVKRCWHEWGGDKGAIEGLPNWSFSVALVEFEAECDAKDEIHETSTLRLEQAMKQYPQFVPLLLTKLTLTDPTITSSPLFTPIDNYNAPNKSEQAIHLLINLYIERCHHLWKEPSALAWFRKTATRLAKTVDLEDKEIVEAEASRVGMYPDGLPLNVSRHVYVSDFGALVPFLPEEARALSLNAFDPMPPPVAEDEDGNGVHVRSGGGMMGWILERLQHLVGVAAGVDGPGEEGANDEDDESDEEWEDGEEETVD
ncbi:UNVERIFIED_CONTAM: Transcription factor 25 [Siphonaria sp. JEL0065]|nr:Transcription factor 25 [Siphonaria sp. JEL0065]